MNSNKGPGAVNKIILDNNRIYYYIVRPFDLIDTVGNCIAILQEYIFTKSCENTEEIFYKLYKTKDGTWYEINDMNLLGDYHDRWLLKTAIDAFEG